MFGWWKSASAVAAAEKGAASDSRTGADIIPDVAHGARPTLGDHSVRPSAPDIRESPNSARALASRVDVMISQADYESLQQHLHQDPLLEQHAFLVAGICRSPRGVRLLVREMVFAGPGDFITQTATYLDLQPSYYLPVIDRCRNEGLHLIEVHSHPFTGKGVRFSSIDIGNELEKFPWYASKVPAMQPATLVFGRESVDGHWWDHHAGEIRPLTTLRVVGPTLRSFAATGAPATAEAPRPKDEVFHRQALAFGAPGQAAIARTRVAIVGCGGLGSILAEQLAYLGIRDFILVDADRVEVTNLNRLVFALPEDAREGRAKVDVIARGIRAVRPDARVEAIRGSIIDLSVQERVKDVDLLIAGTDSDGARMVCNQLAVRYLLPYMDLGTGINVEDGTVKESGGQLWYVHPGGFCLTCTGAIDPYAARVDLMDEVERRRHVERGYGTDTPQPSVIFLNAVVASLAVGEIVKLLTGFMPPQSMVFFDALKPSVQPFVPPSRNPDCPVCHRGALYARGDEPASIAFHRPIPLALPTNPASFDTADRSGSEIIQV